MNEEIKDALKSRIATVLDVADRNPAWNAYLWDLAQVMEQALRHIEQLEKGGDTKGEEI